MGVRVYWNDDQKTILNQVYEGQCVAADFHKCVNDSYPLISSVTHTVDIVVDMTHARFVGASFLSARNNSEAKVQSNQRMAILVGAPGFIKALVGIGKTIAPKTTKNIHFASTVEEAYTLIDTASKATV